MIDRVKNISKWKLIALLLVILFILWVKSIFTPYTGDAVYVPPQAPAQVEVQPRDYPAKINEESNVAPPDTLPTAKPSGEQAGEKVGEMYNGAKDTSKKFIEGFKNAKN